MIRSTWKSTEIEAIIARTGNTKWPNETTDWKPKGEKEASTRPHGDNIWKTRKRCSSLTANRDTWKQLKDANVDMRKMR